MSVLHIRGDDGKFHDLVTVRGLDGKTAYEYAKDGGYTGTEEEFAEKLAQEIPVVDNTLNKVGCAAESSRTGRMIAELVMAYQKTQPAGDYALRSELPYVPQSPDPNTYLVTDNDGNRQWVKQLGYHTIEEQVLVEETEITDSSTAAQNNVVGQKIPIKTGDIAKVTFNGVTYECSVYATKTQAMIYAANVCRIIFNGVGNTTELTNLSGTTGTLSVTVATDKYYTIDPNLLPPATPDTLGGIMPGDGLVVDEYGRASVKPEGEYELVREIVIEGNETPEIMVDQFADGTSLVAKQLLIRITQPPTSDRNGEHAIHTITYNEKGSVANCTIFVLYQESVNSYGVNEICARNGRLFGTTARTYSYTNLPNMSNNTPPSLIGETSAEYFKKVKVASYKNVFLPGTTIKIEAVRYNA